MKKFLRDFREFAFKSDALDLAIGMLIGGAFTTIVKSLVDDLMKPLVTLFYSEVTGLRNLVSPQEIAKAQKVFFSTFNSDFRPGKFFSALVQFVIYAFCVFLLVRAISALRSRMGGEKKAAPDKTVVLLTEIRDLLKTREPAPAVPAGSPAGSETAGPSSDGSAADGPAASSAAADAAAAAEKAPKA